MTIAIVPVPAYPSTGTQLRVDDGHVNLGVGADFQWAILDASGNVVAGPARNTLTPAQYNDWTGDDVYVANAVASNLGLTPS